MDLLGFFMDPSLLSAIQRSVSHASNGLVQSYVSLKISLEQLLLPNLHGLPKQ